MRRKRALPRVVQSRVDMLVIGFRVHASQRGISSLVHAKAKAGLPGAGGGVVRSIGHESFEVLARGRRGHGFVLRNGLAEVLVAETDIEVRIHPPLLRAQGVEGSLAYARDVAHALSDRVIDERVRRLDACADVTFALSDVDATAFVGRPRKSVTYERASERGLTTPTSITFGRGSAMCVRLYDKIEQLRQKNQPAVTDSEEAEWSRHGWCRGVPVTRVEMQLRGEALARLDLRTPKNVLMKIDSAWQYVVGRWLRLVAAGTSTRRERAKLDPRWSVLLDVTFAQRAQAARPLPIVTGGAKLEAALGMVLSVLGVSGLLGVPQADIDPVDHVARAFAGALRAHPTLLASLPDRIAAAAVRFAVSAQPDEEAAWPAAV